MIKKREWSNELINNKIFNILKFEDFYLKTKTNEVNNKIEKAYILGHNIIDIKKFNIMELTYQKMFTKTYMEINNINSDIYEYKNDMIYLVSILSLEALQNFKYTEKLNLLTFAFESESVALLFLNTLEDIRFKLWNDYFLEENKTEGENNEY